MQPRDEVEGLHDCLEFSQPLECLYQAMQTQEKSFLLLIKIELALPFFSHFAHACKSVHLSTKKDTYCYLKQRLC